MAKTAPSSRGDIATGVLLALYLAVAPSLAAYLSSWTPIWLGLCLCLAAIILIAVLGTIADARQLAAQERDQ